MPSPGVPLERQGFLTLGTYDGSDPGPGHEHLLREVVLCEELGLDSVWLRHRHFQSGISSPVTMLAAASQRTSRIEFGTAVTPLGWENPLRYAEDLGTLDVLSGGRMNPGISVGPPIHWDDVKAGLYPDTADVEDLTYARVERLRRLLRGEPASTSPASTASSRSPSTCNRIPPGSPSASGTAGAVGARCAGQASRASRCSPAT
jgi:alkanesulfonate monooxygenase SsuD/methylene tetrahydromethanopterin reductase-like flavin-dependent oxidoreductase (luciferase family)